MAFNRNEIVCTPKMICNVNSGEIVMSRDESTKKNVFVKVKKRHDNGKKQTVTVTLTTGQMISATLDHKFRVEETGEMLSLGEIISKNLSIVVNSSHINVASAENR